MRNHSLSLGNELIDWLLSNEKEWIADREVAKVVGQMLIDMKIIRNIKPDITLMIDSRHVYQFLVWHLSPLIALIFDTQEYELKEAPHSEIFNKFANDPDLVRYPPQQPP